MKKLFPCIRSLIVIHNRLDGLRIFIPVSARTIDAIVLTKFDTIDDKVGACVSMAHSTGQPILFVGTGQTYTDLKVLNVNAVVNALLRN